MSDLEKVGWIISQWMNRLNFPQSIYDIYLRIESVSGKYQAKVETSRGEVHLIIDPEIKSEELDFQIGRAMIFWLVKEEYITKRKERKKLKDWLLTRFPRITKRENSEAIDKILDSGDSGEKLLDQLSSAIYNIYK